MLKEEFEALTGANVGYYFYKMVIEKAYMEMPEKINKMDFSLLFTKRSLAQAQKIFYMKYPEMKEEEKLK